AVFLGRRCLMYCEGKVALQFYFDQRICRSDSNGVMWAEDGLSVSYKERF
ncbi:hypothetical protein KI387_021337, partial [Taxus chinensis]